MHGPLVEAAIRSARAWVGDFSSRAEVDPDRYDARVWERESQEEPRWDPSEAVLLYEEPDFDVYEVVGNPHCSPWDERLVSELAPRVSKDTFDPKRWYPNVDTRKASAAAKILVFVYGDRDERDVRSALGEPPVDGYLVGLFALCGPDRLAPLHLYWRGRQLDRRELSERVRRAVETAGKLPARPKVPAPELPGDVLEKIEDAVEGGPRSGPAVRGALVDALSSLDRSSFLEALDRMVPWIGDGDLGWLDKDEAVADRLWRILSEFPKMSGGKLKLAPWKTGLGMPRRVSFRVEQDSRGKLPWDQKVVDVRMRPSGDYSVK